MCDKSELCPCKLKYLNTVKWAAFMSDDSYETCIGKAKEKFNIGPETSISFADENGAILEADFLSLFVKANPGCLLLVCQVDPVPSSSVLTEIFDINYAGELVSNEGNNLSSCSTLTISESDCSNGSSLTYDDDSINILTSNDNELQEKEELDLEKNFAVPLLAPKKLGSNVSEDDLKTELIKAGGQDIFIHFNKNKYLDNKTRKKLVNLVVNIMVDKYGTDIHKNVKVDYAKALVAIFPCYRTISPKGGYETFFDPDTGAGFLSWRLRTVKRNCPTQRQVTKRKMLCDSEIPQKKNKIEPPNVQVAEIIRFMKNALPDQKEIIKEKMKLTFEYRRSIIKDTTSILNDFPRFLDTPDLIDNDFTQLYPNCRSLEDFMNKYGEKILAIYKNLEKAEPIIIAEEESQLEVWERDTRILLAVLFMLPPTAKGRKKIERVPIKELPNSLIVFCKKGRPLQEIIDSRTTKQPIVIACGPNKAAIDYYALLVDGKILQPEIRRSVDALDLLFKVHYVFDLAYDEALSSFYKFLQYFVYGIDTSTLILSPKVTELVSRILNA